MLFVVFNGLDLCASHNVNVSYISSQMFRPLTVYSLVLLRCFKSLHSVTMFVMLISYSVASAVVIVSKTLIVDLNVIFYRLASCSLDSAVDSSKLCRFMLA